MAEPGRGNAPETADLPLGRVQMRADHWVHPGAPGPLTEDRDPDCVLGIVERGLCSTN